MASPGIVKHSPDIVTAWWADLMKHTAKSKKDDPNYYAHQPETLCTESSVKSFMVGNGEDIYTRLSRSIELAQSEIVLVTCFWAHSPSLEKLAASLKVLSEKVVQSGRRKVRIFIGFSSLSLFQKLFQTASLNGREYHPSEWPKKLNLPPESQLPGLDIHIKSIFVRPFSVMHPKFVIIDRKMAWLPSCNVSWESWFEGAVSLEGPVVDSFVDFWKHFWLRGDGHFSDESDFTRPEERNMAATEQGQQRTSTPGPAHNLIELEALSSVYTVFLPSPHHVNPNFRPWPWIQAHPPPPTPLNHFILLLFQSASSTIYMQTPNLTAPPVLTALFAALGRGVHVHILTSDRLMILEQLVTAGATTTRCINKLTKRYIRLSKDLRRQPYDEESSLRPEIGQLTIEYFKPKDGGKRGEPVQSHLKLTIVDQQWVILGSGNMDRASWYTSQELGVAFHSANLAKKVGTVVHDQMMGRTTSVYP